MAVVEQFDKLVHLMLQKPRTVDWQLKDNSTQHHEQNLYHLRKSEAC